MTKLQWYSKSLHIAIMACFLLPFFFTGCEEKSISENPTDSILAKSDTVADFKIVSADTQKVADSIAFDSLSSSTASVAMDTTNEPKADPQDYALQLSKDLPFLSPILVSKRDTYSGLAILINTILLFPFYSLFLSFFCLSISLIVKYWEPQAIKILLLLESISLFSFFVASPISLQFESLWGFWITFVALSAMVILDVIGWRKSLTSSSHG